MSCFPWTFTTREVLWSLTIALFIDCVLFSSHFAATENATIRNNDAICGRELQFIMSRAPDDERGRIIRIIEEETRSPKYNQVINCGILTKVKGGREKYSKSQKPYNGDNL